MEFRIYLLDTFSFNDLSNRALLSKIKTLPDPKEAIRLFSHLINCQFKWMARIMQDPKAPEMSWWEPIYELDNMESSWNNSLALWVDYISAMDEEELCKEVTFVGMDGGTWAASPKDIALQLNYHSIHHRAQIQSMIRSQGIEPDFVDYIRTRSRKID